jgi:alkanesulfonate monooxygenase
MTRALQVFTTCPPSYRTDPAAYRSQLAEIARWSEDAGCVGTLIYTDNRLYDPWLLAQLVIEQTERLSPLIAVQPVYTHPYTVAKLVATFGHLYSRRLWLNLVAGGFRNDLRALGDDTPHDRRYDRLVEFGLIVKQLVEDVGPTTFGGTYYRTQNLRLTPPLPPELAPGLTVSGSSQAGALAARALDATAVVYPQAASEFDRPPGVRCGIRIGIVARGDQEEAWDVARRRFPADRRGQIRHSLAIAVTDSHWHKQLEARDADGRSPYWLHPFKNYQTFCPYLVGDHATVAGEVARYLKQGITTLILDVPASPVELEQIAVVLDLAESYAHA